MSCITTAPLKSIILFLKEKKYNILSLTNRSHYPIFGEKKKSEKGLIHDIQVTWWGPPCTTVHGARHGDSVIRTLPECPPPPSFHLFSDSAPTRCPPKICESLRGEWRAPQSATPVPSSSSSSWRSAVVAPNPDPSLSPLSPPPLWHHPQCPLTLFLRPIAGAAAGGGDAGEGFCSVEASSECSGGLPLYWKATHPTLAPAHLQGSYRGPTDQPRLESFVFFFGMPSGQRDMFFLCLLPESLSLNLVISRFQVRWSIGHSCNLAINPGFYGLYQNPAFLGAFDGVEICYYRHELLSKKY